MLFLGYSFVIPDAIVLGDLGAYIGPPSYEAIQKSLEAGIETYDYATITSEQWRWLCELEEQCRINLPRPFTREALKNFCLVIPDADYLAVFQQSEIPEIRLNDGRRFVPKVNCTIGRDNKGKYYLGGIGLVYADRCEPKVGYYWVGEVKKDSVAESIVDILSDYFAVQYAFHVLPDRIVEVPGKPQPGQTAPKVPEEAPELPEVDEGTEVKRRVTPIQRTIYISDTPIPTGRKHHYACDCWYVRGFWRKLKDGREIWVSGYYKGRGRLNKKARQSAKNYVLP